MTRQSNMNYVALPVFVRIVGNMSFTFPINVHYLSHSSAVVVVLYFFFFFFIVLPVLFYSVKLYIF